MSDVSAGLPETFIYIALLLILELHYSISWHPLLAVAVLVPIIFTLNLTSCAYYLVVNAIQIVSTSGDMLVADDYCKGLKTVITLSTIRTIWFALYMV